MDTTTGIYIGSYIDPVSHTCSPSRIVWRSSATDNMCTSWTSGIEYIPCSPLLIDITRRYCSCRAWIDCYSETWSYCLEIIPLTDTLCGYEYMIPCCCHILAVIVYSSQIESSESTSIDPISLIPDSHSIDTTDDSCDTDERTDDYSDNFFVEREFHRESDEEILDLTKQILFL